LQLIARVDARANEFRENQIPAIGSSHRVFLTSSFYSRQNSESQEYNRANRNPVGGHVQQVGGIDQPANDNCETKRIKAK
jgi:hypothetical protein